MTWKREQPNKELTTIASLTVSERNKLGVTEEERNAFLAMYNCVKHREIKQCCDCVRCNEQCSDMLNGIRAKRKIQDRMFFSLHK